MNAFTIKDLENISGIKAHTIRIWEQRYSLLSPQRTDTNIRYYSNGELKTILNIALLNKYGYKISEIDKMSPEIMKDKILSLSQVQAQQDQLVNALISDMVDMDTDSFEQKIDACINTKGIEKAIIQIIFPFLERIGILWVTNHVNPGQEHLVTNIIRQKLIVGIETLVPAISSPQTALLFLPEGEHHELGILFTYFLLKSQGVKVIYAGANLPVKDIQFIANFKKPSFLYTHLTSVASNFVFEKFLDNIQQKLPEFTVIITGSITQNFNKNLPNNINLKRSLSEMMKYIQSI